MDFITLSCPSCGGKLQITPDIELFACSFCGHEHIVNRSGGIVSIAPVVAAIEGVKSGVDRTAAELALVRLEREIAKWSDYERSLHETPDDKKLKRKDALLSSILLGMLLIFISTIFESGGGIFLMCGLFLIFLGGAPLVSMFVMAEKRKNKLAQELPRIDHEIRIREIEMQRLREMLKY